MVVMSQSRLTFLRHTPNTSFPLTRISFQTLLQAFFFFTETYVPFSSPFKNDGVLNRHALGSRIRDVDLNTERLYNTARYDLQNAGIAKFVSQFV